MPSPLPCVDAARAAVYRRRRPERTVLYRVVQEHLETWLVHRHGRDGGPPPAWVEGEFRRYLACGIPAHGFARARCADCGHDFLVAFSCKGRAVCPSCNTRRMAAVAAHLVEHVFPRLPVRQWVLSLPKRLRYFVERDAALAGRVLGRFLRASSPGAPADARFGAVSHRRR